MQEVDLDNAMKYQNTKSNYMEFSRIYAQIMKWKKNWPKIWPSKAILAGHLRAQMEAFDWFLQARKVGLKLLDQVWKVWHVLIGPYVKHFWLQLWQ